MSLLTHSEDGVVRIKPEANKLKVVVDLSRAYSTKKFNDIIKYVYHAYSLDHALDKLMPSQRKRRVSVEYFGDEKFHEIEKAKTVRAFIDEYVNLSFTVNQRFYYFLKRDFELFREYLSKIPFTKKKKIQQEVWVDFKDGEGNDRREKVFVDTVIEIDNSAEKINAMKRATELMKQEAELKKQIEQDRIEEKKGGGTFRLFDSRTIEGSK